MLRYLLAHIRRRICVSLCVVLVASVITVSFCKLQELRQAEQENYQQLYHSISVTASVSDLTGRNTVSVEAPYWAVDAFLPGGRLLPDTLHEYVTDVQAKTTWNAYDYQKINGVDVQIGDIVGITSIDAEPQLRKSNGGTVTWFDGYDDSILSGNEPVCILPERLMPEVAENAFVSMAFSRVIQREDEDIILFHQLELRVVGTYQAQEQRLYIPYRQAEGIWSAMKQEIIIDSISGTICNNDLLEQFREDSAAWFAKPDLRGTPTEWGKMNQKYYPHALVIDDAQLVAAENLLSKSIRINDICRTALFIISASIGFLVGFLMIRSRKREIMLMRTMGTPNKQIFSCFALEQVAYVLVGVLIGGFPFLWKPIDQIVVFVIIYIIALSAALLIFLRKNLLTTIKEDE